MATATAKRTATKKAVAPAPEPKAAAPAKAPAARKTATKKAPAKKAAPAPVKAVEAVTPAPAKRTATKKAVAPAKAATPAKKAAARTATKKTTAKAPAKTAALRNTIPPVRTVNLDPYGYAVGSDSSIAAQALVEGGESRKDINTKVLSRIQNTTTRTGNDKVVSTIVGNVFSKLKDQGYTVESHWRLVPPTAAKAAAAPAKRTATRKK